MIANKFGVPNGASLFVYDKYNTFQSISTTCSLNPAHGSYCFSSSRADGDYVNIFVHGYMVKFSNDVSLLLNIMILEYTTINNKVFVVLIFTGIMACINSRWNNI